MDYIFKTTNWNAKIRNVETTVKNVSYIGDFFDAYLNELYAPKITIVYTTKTAVFAHALDFTKEAIALSTGKTSKSKKPCLRIRCGSKDVKKWDTSNDIELGSVDEFNKMFEELKNRGDVAEKMLCSYYGLEWAHNSIKHTDNGDVFDIQVKYFDNSTIELQNDELLNELVAKYDI
jgi:hypothetical protein